MVMVQPKISLQECLNIHPPGVSQYAYVSEHPKSACAGMKHVVKPNDNPCLLKSQIISEHLQIDKIFKFSQARYQMVMLVCEHT